jgi:hypothetical protein
LDRRRLRIGAGRRHPLIHLELTGDAGHFIVRRAVADDVDALVALCAEHADFERSGYECADKVRRLSAALFGPAPRLFAWIAIVDGSPGGYATASPEYSTWNACE